MWQAFFEQQHYSQEQGQLSGIPSIWNSHQLEQGFFTPLTEAGLIQVNGDDAASFLHNQLSNDFEHLDQSEMRRAAYCTPKGRMLADFVYWKNEHGIFLQTHSSILPAVLKRLQMFVLRAKAKLADASNQFGILALGGQQATAALQDWFPLLPEVSRHISNEHGTLIRHSDVRGICRYQWICPAAKLAAVWPALTAKLSLCPATDWDLTEIEAGIAHINAATSEKFVPQMINFELVGGVNFRKGCYPGQEIVARSQYLGKLKRRMTLARIAATSLQDGADIYNAAQPDQPCGVIACVREDSAGSSLALVEMTLADQETGDLHALSADGPALQLLPLPYEIRDITR